MDTEQTPDGSASNKGQGRGEPLKLPPLRHPVKGGMALERAHLGRKQAEADGAAAVAVVDAVDQRRQFLASVIVDGEQVRLVVGGGNQVEQNDTDRQRLGARHALPDLLEAGEQKAGVMRLVKIGFVPTSRRDRPPRTDAGLIAGSSSRRGGRSKQHNAPRIRPGRSPASWSRQPGGRTVSY
jgi:hypothetical protein